ncbi:MAG: TerB family tellurite resistance protein [Bacteroidaceae bacterium]|nr:TerB family tellurite resistance protein [Bacteroidaceae bacterium]
MDTKELLLKTVFACMSCDGDIAPGEVQLVQELVSKTDYFEGLEVETLLNKYIESINQNGASFLNRYLSEVAESELTKEEQLCLVDLAIKTIEGDNEIQYSEIKFFKKIRVRLSLTDEEILEKHPEKEDFLLPDINVAALPEWNDVTFTEIKFGASDLESPRM